MTKPRAYISLYFEDAMSHGKKKRDVTLAFDPDDELYNKIKALGSSEIKRITRINTYDELLKAAKEEDRSLGNFIKHRLRVYIENEKENTTS
jgi:hypothetical protein